MKLTKIEVVRYRSIREETIEFTDLNCFIGANASGKSNILDCLRFLYEGLVDRDFSKPVSYRGNILR